jgi:phosphatidylinositol alpha-1,6-mannosyltransferase
MRSDPLVAVLCEDRLLRSGGQLYSLNSFGQCHWQRYVDVFGDLAVIARVERSDRLPAGAAAASHDRLELREIPSFRGPLALLPKLPKVLFGLRSAVRAADGFIVRWPGTLTLLALPFLLASRKPIAVEVVGDPIAVFRSGVGGPVSALLARLSEVAGRRLFRAAAAVTYVTHRHLQGRYPAAPHAVTAAFSDVILSQEDFTSGPRLPRDLSTTPARLLFAGTMEQNYKGIDTLLAALAILKAQGREASLRIAGQGRLRRSVQDQIGQLELDDPVVLLGQIGRAELLRELDECDLFVLPSRTEGLPRSIIEAMARATPIVATAVGGIPELLPPECLVAPDDPELLASRLAACLEQPALRAAMSKRNLAAAERFTAVNLAPIRRKFYLAFRSLCSAEAAKVR